MTNLNPSDDVRDEELEDDEDVNDAAGIETEEESGDDYSDDDVDDDEDADDDAGNDEAVDNDDMKAYSADSSEEEN